jgi:1-acyl-sn-glycerol-3-phosphate acyltransferase
VTFYKFAVRLVRPLLWLLWRPLAEGIENVPEHGGVLVCNHLRLFDPVLLAICLPDRTLHFLAKEELFRIPILSFVIRKLNAIPVRRNSVDVAAVRKCMRVVSDGGILVIFPEGTRSKTGKLLPFEEGASFIASRCGTVVYPAHIQVGRTRGRRRVAFAPPLNLAEIEPHADKETRLKAMTAAIRKEIIAIARKDEE